MRSDDRQMEYIFPEGVSCCGLAGGTVPLGSAVVEMAGREDVLKQFRRSMKDVHVIYFYFSLSLSLYLGLKATVNNDI